MCFISLSAVSPFAGHRAKPLPKVRVSQTHAAWKAKQPSNAEVARQFAADVKSGDTTNAKKGYFLNENGV